MMRPFRFCFHPAFPAVPFRFPGTPQEPVRQAGTYLENDNMFKLPSTFFFMNLLMGMATTPT